MAMGEPAVSSYACELFPTQLGEPESGYSYGPAVSGDGQVVAAFVEVTTLGSEDPPPGESEECEEICGGSESSQTIAYATADGSDEIPTAPTGGYPHGNTIEQQVIRLDAPTPPFRSAHRSAIGIP